MTWMQTTGVAAEQGPGQQHGGQSGMAPDPGQDEGSQVLRWSFVMLCHIYVMFVCYVMFVMLFFYIMLLCYVCQNMYYVLLFLCVAD